MIFLSGTQAFDGNDPEWGLNSGSGERSYSRRVAFQSGFSNVPMVTANLTGLDISSGGAKFYIGVENVDSTGFDLQIKTWGETRVWAVVVNWLAIGL
jgi:H-type lectin domain